MSNSDLTLLRDSLPVASVHENTSQVVITITEDKLQNILGEYARGLEDRKPWLTILMLVLTLLALTLTDLPQDYKLPITQVAWQSVCGGSTFAALIWFIWAICKSIRAWINKRNVADVIERIKASENETQRASM